VASGVRFDGPLVLRDIFPSDAGWTQPQSDVYRWEIGQGRFLMELIQNRSAMCATRNVTIAADANFLLQVLARSVQPTGFSYGICWFVTGGDAGYFLYLSPGESSGGTYQLLRFETWSQPGPSGPVMRYGQQVNMLDPGDVNRTFPSAAIRSGVAENAIAVVRSGATVKIYINGSYVGQAAVPSASVERVGLFISGMESVEFRDFLLRVR
jgi:hypothetical protein